MAKSESTKYRLAEAMKTCMKTTSVDDITIRQIVEVCGVTRQTFYRNFLDKYDLINWYFDKLLLKSFEHMGEGTTVYDGLVKKFEYLKSKLQRELGWEPSLQFEEGIEKTVRWYLDNQAWMDNITSGEYEKYYDEMYKNR